MLALESMYPSPRSNSAVILSDLPLHLLPQMKWHGSEGSAVALPSRDGYTVCGTALSYFDAPGPFSSGLPHRNRMKGSRRQVRIAFQRAGGATVISPALQRGETDPKNRGKPRRGGVSPSETSCIRVHAIFRRSAVNLPQTPAFGDTWMLPHVWPGAFIRPLLRRARVPAGSLPEQSAAKLCNLKGTRSPWL